MGIFDLINGWKTDSSEPSPDGGRGDSLAAGLPRGGSEDAIQRVDASGAVDKDESLLAGGDAEVEGVERDGERLRVR
ncbi:MULTISPECIES: hypothetical protein [Rhodopseudomonas]|uniref:hypothetical protein n=1 Tax=Rhodopseudomonas TaxID=1073 RepID=UPI001FCE64C4|nr:MULTISPECIES: hypothetical protein [Rhodopseudomonas]